ncbi:DUF5020 family protein [Marinilabilia rubra]|uniref:DUF5020 domain-containing protein n=1 Tax=Marinilabilia rubra TaxID=2162893 RepID=A0A2U2B3M7_9BACT|nr:DUF5020 family protein [Marinilabilia rubra]PWD97666.1 DUF5020 domain-containing protein [Marinilabilia rubra]
MKRVFIAFVFSLFALSSFAQNLQVHYDFGEDRKMVTTTLEMFKPDKYGSTFFFVDFDYSSDSRNIDNGVSLAYWEIARSFKWNETQKFEPRIEFNSGKATGFQIENAWLAGGQYTFNNDDFSKILTVQANYKYIKDKHDASFQLTAVWGLHFMNRKLSFLGFADFWKEDMFWGTEYRFLTEPQIWYNINQNLSLGSEIEISNNFAEEGFLVCPTLAAKWTF